MVTIGRLIADAGGLRAIPPRLDNRGRMKRPRPKKPRKPKGFRAQRPGEVLALDTVIAIRDGVRRTLFGCLDQRSRFAPALVTPGFSSKRAGDFFDLALGLFPGRVGRVLSDNGSEFEGAFARLLKAKGIGRCYTYPWSPKKNAHLGRFGRTVQEEFLIHHEDLHGEHGGVGGSKWCDRMCRAVGIASSCRARSVPVGIVVCGRVS